MATGNAIAAGERELLISRVFDAPRERLFAAWTDPEQVARWWGPKGFTTVFYDMDIRPGGSFRLCMRSPDGIDYWKQGVYREIVVPARLVFTFAWSDPDGKPGPELLVTVTFAAAESGRTLLTLHQGVFETVAARDDHRRGWTGCFERFAQYLAGSESGEAN